MKLDPRLFLEALGTRLVGDPNEVGRRTPLCCRCPLHSSEAKLITTVLPDGNLIFRCEDPTCHFSGDSISLIMAKYGISLQAAINMLRHGGILSNCLETPLLTSEAEALTEKYASQTRVRAYLAKCVQQLSKNPTRSRLRAGLDVSTYNLIPPEVGLLVVSDDMPDAFSEYRKSKYKKSTLLTFPYTFNGEVMHVKIVDASTRSVIDDVSIIRPDFGVFCEEALYDGTTDPVQVVTDPVAMSIYYGTLRKSMLVRPKLVSISGFPLPNAFSGVSSINILEFSDSKVSLDFLLEPLGNNDLIEGVSVSPNIRFYRRASQSLDAHSELYSRATDTYRHGAEDGMMALQVLAERMSELADLGKSAQIEEALRRHPLSDENREHLLEFIIQGCLNDECRKLLIGQQAGGPRRLVLGNRKTLITEATALYVERPDLKLDPLANFGIRVLNRTRSFDGVDSLTCTVTPEDKSVQPVDVSISEDMWSSSSRMRRLISKAFSSKGASPYIAMYTPCGVDWYDVMLKLAEGCRIQREIVKLGVDELHDVQFPNTSVETRTKTISQQEGSVNVPADVVARYKNVGLRDGYDAASVLNLLLSKSDSMHVSAFLAGLGYMTYRLAKLSKRGTPPSHGGRHLFFVETEENCFETTIQQLNSLFTDEPVVEVSPGAPVKSLLKYRQLGSLPLVCRIPRVENIQRLLSTLDEVEFPVIASVDSYTASLLNGRIRAEYVTPSNEFPNQPEIQDTTIRSISSCMPRIILDACTGEVSDDADSRAPSSVLGYRMLCKIANSQPTDCVKNMVSLVFAGAGMSGVDSFFEKLHYGVIGLSNKFKLCVVYGQPQSGYSFTKRGQHVFVMDDVVLIGKYIVDLVNKFSTNVYSISQLDSEFHERELLVAPPDNIDVDMSRCWCIPREVYEDRILGKPLVIDKIEQ